MKDNRLPVSQKLLTQLCDAADTYLTEYSRTLAKSMFICTWAFGMRVSEYSRKKPNRACRVPSHNVRENSIRTSEFGLSIVFHSDKTSQFNNAVKHRTLQWAKLPDCTRAAVERYSEIRPHGAPTFFCHFDGKELTRSEVLNLLHVCLLSTEWRHLNITPHSFHQGYASERLLVGDNIGDIQNHARWTERTKAFEAYARSDLVTLSPADILKIDPKYQKRWTADRLKYLIQHVIETPGAAASHPFTLVLRLHFNNADSTLKKYFPEKFPHEFFSAKRALEEKAFKLGTFTQGSVSQAVVSQMMHEKKSAVSSILRKQTISFRYPN